MSILSDDFKIDSYLNKPNETIKEEFLFTESRIHTDIDCLWLEYCQLPKSERIKQDKLCFEKYGLTCQGLYESEKENSDNLLLESGTDTIPEYTDDDVDGSITWSKETNIPIIRPVKNLEKLEELWQAYSSFPSSIRQKSDKASIQFYGITNRTHYQYLKSRFLQDGFINYANENTNIIRESLRLHEKFICNSNNAFNERVKDLLSLLMKKNEAYDDAIISSIVDKAIDDHITNTQDIQYDVIPFEDLPFYTPEELIDGGIFQALNDIDRVEVGDIISEDDMIQWLNQYSLCYYGICSEGYDPLKWKNMIKRLSLKLFHSSNKRAYSQAIQNLGWPSTACYCEENQVKASKRIKMLTKEAQGSTQIIDISGFTEDTNAIISESADTIALKPVFLILEAGKSLFSKSIKFVTKSQYSHAAISFDPKLEEMISFGIEGSKKGAIGGLIKENIKEKSKDIKFAVFTIFLKEDDWNKLKENIDKMVKNVNKTIYSYFNIIISQLFRIPVEFDMAMVCSQFVDKMLKLVDVDITKINSALVSPANIEKAARKNKKIYKLFEGSCKRYNSNIIIQKINALLRKAKPIKENSFLTDSIGSILEISNSMNSIIRLQELDSRIDLNSLDPRVAKIYTTMIQPCLEAECYSEAKEAPVQMDKYGNLFIKNIKKRDYETDYQSAHKLLREYEKSGNIEGMKYELARLWAMQLYIEEKIHSKKFLDMDLDERNSTPEMKVYPKLVNDIQHFLGIVMKQDPKFNFSKYYEKTQFNSDNIKINHDTIIWAGKYLKAMLSGI